MINLDFSCVVVTYNRLDKLKKTLEAYDRLVITPINLIVVDNASDVDTKIFLDGWKEKSSHFKKFVIHLPYNIGGSGGFYTGIKKATQLEPDWIFVGDDDAYPKEDCIEKLTHFIEQNREFVENNVSAICTSVYEAGNISKSHRRRLQKSGLFIRDISIDEKEYRSAQFELDLFSYVGTAMRKDMVLKAGLPEKDFFIYYDDTEHSIRIRSEGKIYCIPEAIMYHDTKQVQAPGMIDWKKYYSIRNKLICYKMHFGKRIYCLALIEICKAVIKLGLNRNTKEFKLRIVSICDGINLKKGKNTLYKPGWKL